MINYLLLYLICKSLWIKAFAKWLNVNADENIGSACKNLHYWLEQASKTKFKFLLLNTVIYLKLKNDFDLLNSVQHGSIEPNIDHLKCFHSLYSQWKWETELLEAESFRQTFK